MLNLEKITLCAVACVRVEETIKALEHSCKNIQFGKILLLTDQQISHNFIEVKKINKLDYRGYNEFVLKYLNSYIDTDFVLIIQDDGFILNHNSWDTVFYNYDYIGAPWSDGVVGNGGFCLRSKKLLFETSLMSYDFSPEDVFICRTNKSFLEKKGLIFAPFDIANKFSVESKIYSNQFGFHGRHTIEFNPLIKKVILDFREKKIV